MLQYIWEMDIRLMIDAGPPPKAPPGKIAESPPPEEFQKTLQIAKKEETPGEVAENEPNAQLQTLDSEKEKAGNSTPVDLLFAPIQFQTSVASAASWQFIEVSRLLPNGASKALTIDFSQSKASNLSQIGAIQLPNSIEQLPLLGDQSLPSISSGAPLGFSATIVNSLPRAFFEETLEPEMPAQDAIQDSSLSALVSTLFEKQSNLGLSKSVPGAPSLQYGLENSNPKVPPIKVPDLIAEVAKKVLNISSIQSSTSTLVDQVSVSKFQVTQMPEVPKPQQPISDEKGIKAESLSTDKAVINVSSPNLGSRQNQGDSEKNDTEGEKQIFTPESQPKPLALALNQELKPIQTLQLTPTERLAMVESISRQIEELATKSIRNEVRVEMSPPDLGSVVVNIRKDMAGLSATLSATNEPLRQALHESRNDLAGALADRSVGQVRIEVRGANPDTSNMGQQFSQSESQHHHQQQHQTRQSTKHAGDTTLESKDLSAVEPTPRRTVTTKIDMEI